MFYESTEAPIFFVGKKGIAQAVEHTERQNMTWTSFQAGHNEGL